MQRNPIKLLMLGSGGVTFAGLFGMSLASYAESGSFEFYKQRPYDSGYVAQSAPLAEMASYPISPPSPPETSPAALIAAPRPVYAPGYPGDSWPEDSPAALIQAVAYEPVAPEDGMDARRIPETGGSWTEPARRLTGTPAEADDEEALARDPNDSDTIKGTMDDAD